MVMLVDEKPGWEVADNRIKCGEEACLAYISGLQEPERENKMHTDSAKPMLKLADCKVNGSFNKFLKSLGQKCFTHGWHDG